ncbi:dTMP kinase [Corynebacterium uterequi]|uniref:Thymidylate kinase n=1 Tax=Corynebacterium uterequi TaxID=1072256 RepID=A0A0G3HB22_9CORY|nr:dTMP kinase [Corynebacterium uterequi]AKK10524.1 thymidylate kinase [Corynebacterium uterequi]
MIVTVEGIDGAGKNTLVERLTAPLGARRLSFPRYEQSIHAQLAQEALHGRMGDLTDSAYAMATLFALDRHGARDLLEAYVGSPEVLVLDRYVASNAAYTWARTGDQAAADWVAELEFSRLGLPEPDLQILLATDPVEARRRARGREQADATRARDAYERDAGLQERTFAAYQALAQRSWHSPWLVTADANEALATMRTTLFSPSE